MLTLLVARVPRVIAAASVLLACTTATQMLVDDIGDVTITNDGATILKQLEVEHPAAKILVELAQLQDSEVGDGTTSVVVFAAELLKRANGLVRNKIHPTSIISGFRLAMRESCRYIEGSLSHDTASLGEDTIINIAKTSMSSKILGVDDEFFARLAVDALKSVRMVNSEGNARYPVNAVSVLKAHGRSIRESRIINGYALNVARAAQGMPTRVEGCKVACLDMDLRKTKMAMGVQVLVTDPRELERIREREATITRDRVEKIIAAGANVVLCSKGIDDLALKYFVEAGVIAARRVPKEDLRRIAKATGAQVLLTLADEEGDETFPPEALGECEVVEEVNVSDDMMLMLEGCKTHRATSVLLRGANDFMLDEMDRALHDSFCVIKRALESDTVCVGGGCVEASLSIYLEQLATTLGSREQLAIAEFAEALLVIPKTLAVNAAKDATDLVAKLRAYHHTAQNKPGKEHLAGYGLDLVNGVVRNNLEEGVLEPAMSKVKSIQFATEAAITILRIDDLARVAANDPQQ